MPKKAQAKKTGRKKKILKKLVSKKKVVPKKVLQKKGKTPQAIGEVTHFFGNIKVAIVKFKKPVKTGKEVWFKGATTDFRQRVDSIQYDHRAITVAKKGKEVGVKVRKKVREGDGLFEAE